MGAVYKYTLICAVMATAVRVSTHPIDWSKISREAEENSRNFSPVQTGECLYMMYSAAASGVLAYNDDGGFHFSKTPTDAVCLRFDTGLPEWYIYTLSVEVSGVVRYLSHSTDNKITAQQFESRHSAIHFIMEECSGNFRLKIVTSGENFGTYLSVGNDGSLIPKHDSNECKLDSRNRMNSYQNPYTLFKLYTE